MSETHDAKTDRIAIRKAIRETIRAADEPVTRQDLIATVGVTTGASDETITDELDALEREGFVYLVGDDEPKVKLPGVVDPNEVGR